MARIYKLAETLGNVEHAEAWQTGSFHCFSCGKLGEADESYYKSTAGNLCVGCVETELKKASRLEDLMRWTSEQYKTALSPTGHLRHRLIVLWRFREILMFVERRNLADAEGLKTLLLENVGFQDAHPLAQTVRQAALHACRVVDKSSPNAGGKKGILQALVKQLNPVVRELVKVGVTEQPEKQSTAASAASEKLSQTEHLKYTLIEEIVRESYSADALKRIYAMYLSPFFDEPDPDLKSTVNKLKKDDLARKLAQVFVQKDAFQQFWAKLPSDVQSIFQTLIWEGGEHPAESFEKTYHIEISKKTKGVNYGTISQDIHNPYLLFLARRESLYYGYGSSEHYKYYLYFPDELRLLLKDYLPHPPGYELTPLTEIEPTKFLYEHGDRVLQQLPLFYTYIAQGNLKVSQSTGKVLKTSFKQMAKYCNIEEFYDDAQGELAYLKTKLIIDFCRAMPVANVEASPQFLKQLWQDFLKKTGYESYHLHDLLTHLQGLHNLRGGHYEQSHQANEKQVRASLMKLLRRLPVGQWMAVENLVQYCLYRDVDLDIVDKSFAKNYLHFQQATTRKYYDSERVSIGKGLYKDVVFVPFMKAAMFLFSILGIVDLAYNLPENPMVQEAGKKYLSVFDGLRYIRLNPLGAYLIGVAETYAAQIEEERAELLLDDKRLIVAIEGKDRLKTLVLEKIADKISDKCYKVNYQSFLKECTSKADIERKIELFYTQVAAKPPHIWQEFLDEVSQKINPLTPKQTMTVYKLNQNKELIHLIARDEVLKKYLFKAEDYHIVIDSKHIGKVKKRLEEFGYFIDNI